MSKCVCERVYMCVVCVCVRVNKWCVTLSCHTDEFLPCAKPKPVRVTQRSGTVLHPVRRAERPGKGRHTHTHTHTHTQTYTMRTRNTSHLIIIILLFIITLNNTYCVFCSFNSGPPHTHLQHSAVPETHTHTHTHTHSPPT